MAASFSIGTCPILNSGTAAASRSSKKVFSALRTVCISPRHSVTTKSLSATVFPCVRFSLRQQYPCSSFVRRVSVAPEALVHGEEEEEELEAAGEQESESEAFKLFVGNLPFSVDSAQLAELFQEAGEVNMVEVIYDRATGRSRGFAFVNMASQEGANEAVERFDGFEFQGRQLRVNAGPPPPRESRGGGFRNNYSGERSGPPPRESRGGGFRNNYSGERSGSGSSSYSDSPHRIFVGNLPWAADQLSLEQLFSDYGNVLDAKVVYDRETGRSRGFGFVTLSSAEEVEQAISSLNGMDLNGRPIRVDAAETRRPRF